MNPAVSFAHHCEHRRIMHLTCGVCGCFGVVFQSPDQNALRFFNLWFVYFPSASHKPSSRCLVKVAAQLRGANDSSFDRRKCPQTSSIYEKQGLTKMDVISWHSNCHQPNATLFFLGEGGIISSDIFGVNFVSSWAGLTGDPPRTFWVRPKTRKFLKMPLIFFGPLFFDWLLLTLASGA